MIRSVQQGLLDDGSAVPVTNLCTWFDVPRGTVYSKPTKAAPKLDDTFVAPLKTLIEEEPSFGYRTVAWLLGFNSEAPNAFGPSEWAEHGAAGLSAQRLASAQAIHWRATACGGAPHQLLSGPMNNGRLIWHAFGMARMAGHVGFGDGLPQEGTAWLAKRNDRALDPVAERTVRPSIPLRKSGPCAPCYR